MEKSGLLDKGHHLFTNQFYTKVPLALKLHERNTYFTGAINKNSQYLATTLKNTELEAVQTLYFRHKNILFVSSKQNASRKSVFTLTTACHAEDNFVQSKKGLEAVKPVLIHMYRPNQYMSGVDVSDKSIYHTSCTRQTTKYWKRILLFPTHMCCIKKNPGSFKRNRSDRRTIRGHCAPNAASAGQIK
ncbi:uncharacterized protein LOC128984606 [Macrosteles quadrilineatus]|uniref:uncharacterized protein LOC128984606 n=1 Tax=Macrosteles quadrilineatus TaxID=74068 RepID=UPI0023E3363D|nr:uncharacterized protein LOC128984606 [Macrosteles quadrilineatus]